MKQRPAVRSGWLLVLAFLASACAGPINQPDLARRSQKTKSVVIVNYGWHTGVAIRKADIPPTVIPESRDFPDADFVEIGWGDWDYYRAADPGLGMALKASFWSSRSALHVIGFKGSAEDHFRGSEVVEIAVSDDGLGGLVRFVAETFLRSEEGLPAEGSPGLYANSRFYPARGQFHLFRNCNTWVAEALQSAGLPVSTSFAITAGNVMNQARRFGTVRAPGR